ncbi:MAG: GGDEF domain-containing protein [Eubacteriales bacterium]
MDKIEYNKRVNRALLLSWIIISTVLSVAYIIEVLKGLRSFEYTVGFLTVVYVPLIVTIAKNKVSGGADLRIKYYAVIGYCIFYTFTIFTTREPATFVYIIPMISILIVYCDAMLVTLAYVYAIFVNLVVIYSQYMRGMNTKEDITFYEIQIACLLLSCVFLNIALKLVSISVNKMFELSDDILIDELSQAYNRKFVSSRIIPMFNYSKTPNISMAFLDIDNFRDYNTKYGHEVGDNTIKTISKVVKNACKQKQKIYLIRIGGDEFEIVSFGWNYEKFIHFCENIRKEISNVCIEFQDECISVSVSMGLANTLASNVFDYFDLREVADEQLYISKDKGRNMISCAMPPAGITEIE